MQQKQPENFIPIITKLRNPMGAGRVIHRSRLRLPNVAQLSCQVVTIVAPAGYGKSVLMSDWFQQLSKQKIACTWFNCDHDDNDIAIFVRYLFFACRELDETSCIELDGLMKSGSMGDPKPIITLILNNLQATQKQFTIFIDDFHLIDDDDVLQFMQWFIDHLPQQLLLVIASRHILPLKLQRFKAHGHLIEYNYQDLIFKLDETKQYFNKLTSLDLSTKNLHLIQHNSEGWIIALQLFSLILKSKENIDDCIHHFSGNMSELSAYLTEVVLSGLEESLRQFVLKSSCLDRMSASLCDYIFEQNNSGEVLKTIHDMNLLLIPLDGSNEWFRFHHLFGEFLLDYFRKEQPKAISVIHGKASDWFATQHLHYEAIHYALQAKRYDQAAKLMSVFAYHIVENRGDTGTMMQWIKQLPEDYLAKYPAIWSSYIVSLIFSHNLHKAGIEINKLAKFAEKLSAECQQNKLHHDPSELQCAHEYLSIQWDIFHGRYQKVQDNVFHWVKKWPNADPFRRATMNLSLSLSKLNMHEYHEGIECVDQAAGICLQAGNYYMYAWGGMIKAILLNELGQTAKAKDTLESTYAVVTKHVNKDTYYAQMLSFHLAEILYERGEIDAAIGLKDSLLALETWSAYFSISRIVSTLIRYHFFNDNFAKVFEISQFWQQVGVKRQQLVCTNYFKYYEVIYYIENKQLANAELALGGINLDFDALYNDPYLYRGQQELVDKAKIEIAICRQEISEIDVLLEQYIARSRETHSIKKLLYFLLKMARVQQIKGDDKAAEHYVAQSLQIVLETHFISLLVEAGQGMEKMIKKQIAGLPVENKVIKDRVLDLFSHFRQPSRATHEKMAALTEPLTKRELMILQKLDSDKPNEMIANELYISIKTLKWHLGNIYGKLGVKGRLAAIKSAKEYGLMAR